MTGAVTTTIPSAKTVSTGFHIYTSGVVLQQTFLLCFAILMVAFDRKTRTQPTSAKLRNVKAVLRTMYLSLGLITVRIADLCAIAVLTSTSDETKRSGLCFGSSNFLVAIRAESATT